jgi:hypothetical protein
VTGRGQQDKPEIDDRLQQDIMNARRLAQSSMTGDNVKAHVAVEIRRPTGDVPYFMVVIKIGKRQVMNISQKAAEEAGAISAVATVRVANRVLHEFVKDRESVVVTNLNPAWKRLSKTQEAQDIE